MRPGFDAGHSHVAPKVDAVLPESELGVPAVAKCSATPTDAHFCKGSLATILAAFGTSTVLGPVFWLRGPRV